MRSPLARWRARVGLTQVELACALRVARGTVQHWERARQRPPPYLWQALAALEHGLETPPEASAA